MLTNRLSQNEITLKVTGGSGSSVFHGSLDEFLSFFLHEIEENPDVAFESDESLQGLRQSYLDIQKLIAQERVEEFDEYQAISTWHGTEAFAVLLAEHFRRAKQAVLQAGN